MKSFLFCFWRLLVRFSLDLFKKRVSNLFSLPIILCTVYDIMAMTSRYSNLFFYFFLRFVMLQNGHSTWCVETCTTIIIYIILRFSNRAPFPRPVLSPPHNIHTNITCVHKHVKLCPQVHIVRTERNFPSLHTHTHTRARTCTRPLKIIIIINKALLSFFFIII